MHIILNWLIILQIAQPSRVFGVCLIHCTGTTAGFMESLKDKVCCTCIYMFMLEAIHLFHLFYYMHIHEVVFSFVSNQKHLSEM